MAQTTRLTIFDRATLARARNARDFDEVVIETRRLKYSGLLPCAVKFATWAVKPYGRIFVQHEGFENPTSPPYEVPLNSIRQWVVTFSKREAEIVDVSPTGMVLRRTSPVLQPGWSAGVIFSGNEKELTALHTCLSGLLKQPELSPERGGEIVVCGPPGDVSFLDRYAGRVRHLEYAAASGPRFLVGRKKNTLIASLKGPRVVVLHLRVVLQEDALASVPLEFDMSSPNTFVLQAGRRVPYLSLCQTEAVWPGRMPRRSGITMRGAWHSDPLRLHERGPVFVDGGAFFVTKRLHEECPLDDYVAWEEGEDVEWCTRAFLQGFLIDLAPASLAMSQTSKLRPLPDLGPATVPAYRAYQSAHALRAGLSHAWARMTGRR